MLAFGREAVFVADQSSVMYFLLFLLCYVQCPIAAAAKAYPIAGHPLALSDQQGVNSTLLRQSTQRLTFLPLTFLPRTISVKILALAIHTTGTALSMPLRDAP